MFKPNSVAVIGASEEPGTPGDIVMRNLLAGKFIGPVIPVDENLSTCHGLPVSRAVDTMPLTPDLALICSPPETIPDYVLDLGRRGTQGAVVLSEGVEDLPDDERTMLGWAAFSAARMNGMRLLWAGGMGFINPDTGINASLAHTDAEKGRIAFVTQSDSLFTTVLDWANSKNIGFSHYISLGDIQDIGFGTVLDFLNNDAKTKAILLYVEHIKEARTFLSAARATARNKPVLVMKGGRSEAGAKGLAMAVNAMPGADDVYDAAFRRAGMLRVFDVASLFQTAETIARAGRPKGSRPLILTNGMASGLLALDLLVANGVVPAELSPEAREHEVLRDRFSGEAGNPINLPRNATPERYAEAVKILLKQKEVDALLVFHAPSASVSSEDVAKAVAGAVKRSKVILVAGRLGGEDSSAAADIYTEANIPSFNTPEACAGAFLNLVLFQRNQDMLMETPASLPAGFEPESADAGRILENAIKHGRELLSVPEAAEVLTCYDVPILPSHSVYSAEDAGEAADRLGYPVALKILSKDIVRKTDAGGVVLGLESHEMVVDAAKTMWSKVSERRPQAELEGFMVQKMGPRLGALELFISAGTDPVFGPYIRFGQGGAAADAVGDNAVAIPPLNMSLARELVERTRISRLLKSYEAGDIDIMNEVCLTLVKVSQMLVDHALIHTLLINPLFTDAGGVHALDAAILVEETEETGPDRLAIRPYPKELEVCVELENGRQVLIRPIRPEDEPEHWDFFSKLSVEDVRFRFFGYIRELPRHEMVRLTQIDYNREMAFIAQAEGEDGKSETLGVVRAMTKPDNSESEFAVIVRSDLKGQGLGRLLMEKIVEYCKSRDTGAIIGQALLDNKAMATLALNLGFDVKKNYEDEVWDFRLSLKGEETKAAD